MKKKKISKISVLHYIRLIYRSVLFLAILISYISFRVQGGEAITEVIEKRPLILVITWIVFTVEMALRFFPSRLESPGCQKQFGRNYIKSGETNIRIQDNNATVLVALIWITLNVVIGVLRLSNILDDGILILISCAFSVCDMICILFFCPFQSWFLKNKCCGTCRIYNWDYAMMFFPLLFIRKAYALSLLGISLALLFRWEITFYRYPERFAENTNEYLQCKNCKEKLCTHKKQLQSLWRNVEKYTKDRIRKLRRD